jgi:hypothetical protein
MACQYFHTGVKRTISYPPTSSPPPSTSHMGEKGGGAQQPTDNFPSSRAAPRISNGRLPLGIPLGHSPPHGGGGGGGVGAARGGGTDNSLRRKIELLVRPSP